MGSAMPMRMEAEAFTRRCIRVRGLHEILTALQIWVALLGSTRTECTSNRSPTKYPLAQGTVAFTFLTKAPLPFVLLPKALLPFAHSASTQKRQSQNRVNGT